MLWNFKEIIYWNGWRQQQYLLIQNTKTKQIFTYLFKCLLKVPVIVFTDQDFPNFKNELYTVVTQKCVVLTNICTFFLNLRFCLLVLIYYIKYYFFNTVWFTVYRWQHRYQKQTKVTIAKDGREGFAKGNRPVTNIKSRLFDEKR